MADTGGIDLPRVLIILILVLLVNSTVECYPTSCKELKELTGLSDGEYCIAVQNTPVPIYCHMMDTETPREYITLRSELNVAQITVTHPNSVGVFKNDTTTFHRVAINTTTMTAIVDDFSFTDYTSVDQPQPWGQAISCNNPPGEAAMSINLTGTVFHLNHAVVFGSGGSISLSDVTVWMSADRKEATCSVGGACGICGSQTSTSANVHSGEGNGGEGPIILDLEGASIISHNSNQEKHDCLETCTGDATCTTVLYSAALSDCVLLPAPPVCDSNTIPSSYQQLRKDSTDQTCSKGARYTILT